MPSEHTFSVAQAHSFHFMPVHLRTEEHWSITFQSQDGKMFHVIVLRM
jgi:hypothetical protein